MTQLTHERVTERMVAAGWRWMRSRAIDGVEAGDYWTRPGKAKKREAQTVFVPTNRAFRDYDLRLEEAALESGLWEMRLCEVPRPVPPDGLTRREWQILQVLREHDGEFIREEAMMGEVTGWEDELPGTGKVYVSRLRRKGYEIETRYGHGYRLVGEPAS